MRAIICCAGKAVRWGVKPPKHLIQIDGKPLLHHTIDGLVARGVNDIFITAFSDLYKKDGAVIVSPTMSLYPNTGLGHSVEYWSDTDRTVVIFGDVFFSKRALDKIIEPTDNIQWYGRDGRSNFGCPHGELFAIAFMPKHHEEIKSACQLVLNAKKAGEIERTSGWELYRVMNKIPYSDHIVGDNFCDINDETDDFDSPADFKLWRALMIGRGLWNGD